MLPSAQKGNAEIIEKVVALLRERVPEEKIAETERFIRQYYRRVEADDLAERNLPDLCCAALAQLDFMRVFKAGAAKVRVYNPQSARDGWQSTHTVVEIVNGDMPFLVDSGDDGNQPPGLGHPPHGASGHENPSGRSGWTDGDFAFRRQSKRPFRIGHPRRS